MTHGKPSVRFIWLRNILLILGIALAGIALILLTPWNTNNLASHPNPVSNYAKAVQWIETLWPADAPEMNPDCRLQFMTHGQKVERAIILVHGYTECPHQFQALGRRFYDHGYNVLIAPLPHHGLADRLTDEQALFRAEEMAAYADETVNIAQGLGDDVTMMGLSAGGLITAWVAQNRADLDLAVVISPGFGFKQVPTPLTAAFMNVYSLRPNSFTWWMAELQEAGSPPTQYPRYSTHALAQVLRLGFAVQAQARWTSPAAQKMVVVFNTNDTSINNELNWNVVKDWQAHNANLTIYEFPASLALPHDIIDLEAGQPVEMVHSQLLELCNP